MLHNKPNKETEEIGYEIANFFAILHNHDQEKTCSFVKDVQITDVGFIPGRDGKKGTVTIYTARPGLLIGRKGVIINELINHLKLSKRVQVERVDIIESFSWTSFLMPVDLANYFD